MSLLEWIKANGHDDGRPDEELILDPALSFAYLEDCSRRAMQQYCNEMVSVCDEEMSSGHTRQDSI